MAEREKIDMTPEEVVAFLRSKRRLLLGVLEEDGSPAADTAPYVLEGGSLYFALPADSPALARIRRDDRVCAIVEQAPRYYEIKAVTVHGHATEVAEAEERRRLLAALVGEGAAQGERVVLRLPLAGVVSFDFSKIQRRP